MNGIVLVLAAAVTGVDVGWQPVAGGGFEYIIQIEPEALEAMRSGEDIVSMLPSHLHNVRQYRITIGTGPLPRIGMPPEMQQPEAATEPAAAPPETTRPSPFDRTARGPAPGIGRPTEPGDRPPAVDDPFPEEPAESKEPEGAAAGQVDEQRTVDPFTRDPLNDPFDNPIRPRREDAEPEEPDNGAAAAAGDERYPNYGPLNTFGPVRTFEADPVGDDPTEGGSVEPLPRDGGDGPRSGDAAPQRPPGDEASSVGDRLWERFRDAATDPQAAVDALTEGGEPTTTFADREPAATDHQDPGVKEPRAPELTRPADGFDWNFPAREPESTPPPSLPPTSRSGDAPTAGDGAETTPRPFLNDDEAVRLAASFPKADNQKSESKMKSEPVHPKPWLPLTFTLLGLFVSMGGNAYLSWITLGLRRQYAALLDRFKQRRQD